MSNNAYNSKNLKFLGFQKSNAKNFNMQRRIIVSKEVGNEGRNFGPDAMNQRKSSSTEAALPII